jgi:hypothetical protein
VQRVRIDNFRKQPCGSPESSQNSRRTASLSSPLWHPHGYPNPTTVRLASSILVTCPELHPRNSNGPRGNAGHRPKGVKSEFPQRKYTPPGPAKKRRNCSRSARICRLRTKQRIDPKAGCRSHWIGFDRRRLRRSRKPVDRSRLGHPCSTSSGGLLNRR